MAKRRHVTLSLTDKIEVIKKLDRGEKIILIAKEYNIGKSTVSEIKKKRESILAYCSKVECDLSTRKTLRPAKHPEVEQALYEWYLQQRAENVFITGDTICEKARFFYKEMTQKDDFRASKGWIDHFKKRFGIKLSALKGENMSGSVVNCGEFKNVVEKEIMENELVRSQVYYVGEASLFWKSVPENLMKSSLEEREKATFRKDKLAFLTCCNADGTHKLNITVANNDENLDNLPVKYFNRKSIIMSRKALSEWFHEEFIPRVRTFLKSNELPEKALVMIDNYCFDLPMYEELKSEDNQIRCLYLPPSVTRLNQPSDQTLNHWLKLNYKKTILNYLLSSQNVLSEAVKELSLKSAIDFLNNSWQKVSEDAVVRFWKAFWPLAEDNDEDLLFKTVSTNVEAVYCEFQKLIEHFTPTTSSNSSITLEEIIDWVNEEERMPYFQSDKEIVEKVKGEFEKQAMGAKKQKVSNEAAIKAFEVCLKWAEQNRVYKSERIVLQRLRNRAANASTVYLVLL